MLFVYLFVWHVHTRVQEGDTRMLFHFHVKACLIQSHYSGERVGNVESLIGHTCNDHMMSHVRYDTNPGDNLHVPA